MRYGLKMFASARAVIWPARLKNPPKLFGRLGRVIHWASVALGVVIGGSINEGSIGAGLLLFALCAMIGRGIRYILSAE